MTASYVWDADNRVAAVVPDRLTAGATKLLFGYDYQGGRVRKTVYTYDGGWNLTSDTAFVYDGWKLLLELDVTDPNAMTITRRYTWGLDLAGLSGAQSGSIGVSPVNLEAAGTIGGLLAMNDPADDPNDVAQDYVYFHDASGNVTQLVDLAADPNAVVADPTAAIVTHYEYGPYGRRVNADPNNPDAYDQPFGFSGKYWDAETGLGNWGRRYYHPTLGRWISRDPIEEAGGLNVYAYVGNNPASRHDGFGLHSQVCWIASGNCGGNDSSTDYSIDIGGRTEDSTADDQPLIPHSLLTVYRNKPLCFNYCIAFYRYCLTCAEPGGAGCLTNLRTCLNSCTVQPPSGGYKPHNPVVLSGCSGQRPPPFPPPFGGPIGPGGGGIGGNLPGWLQALLGAGSTQVTGSELLTALGLGPDIVRIYFCERFRQYMIHNGYTESTDYVNDPEFWMRLIPCLQALGYDL